MLLVLICLNIAWFNISNNVLLRKHDRDIALSLRTSAALLATAYKDEFSGGSTSQNSDVISQLRMLSQTPGVSCVSIHGKTIEKSYPPKAFCSNFEIRDTAQVPIDSNHTLVYHLNEKYLDEIKSESIIYSSIFLFSSFSAFMLFNYFGYRNVASIRIGELLKANNLFFKYSPIPTAEVHGDGTVGNTSLSWNDFFGDPKSEKVEINSLATGSSKTALNDFVKRHFESAGSVTRAELSVIKADGHTVNVQAQLSPANKSGQKAFLSITDIDKLKKIADLRTEQALRDELTGVGSRRSFYEFFEQCTDTSGYYCFLLDIDDFKSVNDLYGHQVGDYFLKTFTVKYNEVLGHVSQIFRLGGEEFVFVVEAEYFGKELKDKLQNLQNYKFIAQGQKISRTFSGGCTFFRGNEPVSAVLKRCDLYLARAKQLGKAQIIYDDHNFIFDDHAPDLMLEAIETGQIKYYFQPIFSQSHHAVIGCEALIRWQRGDTIITPQSFLNSYYKVTNLLQEENLRHKLFFSSVSDLCTALVSYVTYNIMSSDLRPQSIESLIELYAPLKADLSIVLEINEAELQQSDLESSIENIFKQLKDAGFKIALDDFGKDSSNFHRLIEWDVDIIKIDRSLITDIQKKSKKFLSVKAISSLAKELKISLVAEGVETADEVEALTSLGIDVHQGYFYAHPMDKPSFIKFCG